MKPTVQQVILEILTKGRWLAPYELRRELQPLGFQDVEAVTARIRDLRKPQFGRHCVKKQRRAGTTYYEYKVFLPAEQAKAA